ncbi:Leucine carboxyl methyltransferase 1, partial [Phlyctochytrium bullatum]
MLPPPSPATDDAVRSTNDDATACRASAVQLGYMEDPFIGLFSKHSSKRSAPVARKPPIINRGTYARSVSIDNLVRKFLQGAKEFGGAQVVVLGAGFDTRYFLLKEYHQSKGEQPVRYFEIDFQEIAAKKCMVVKRNSTMNGLLGESKLAGGGCEIHGQDYFLLSGDLRDWDQTIVPKLKATGFDA